jgi:transaldolase
MHYFKRVHHLTPTVFWINNPTRQEADWAIGEGALGCTCNPSYCGKMLFDRPDEKDYVNRLLDQIIREVDSATEAQEELQRRLVGVISDKFMPIYSQFPGEHGYVSIQGDPINEHDPEVIIREARKNRSVGDNICCKIPTTNSGLKAMETLVAEDIPINATEVFAIQQALDLCELYEKISKKSGKRPKFYISHITGIYDEYLAEVATKDNINISNDILWQAGLSIARKLYQIYIDRGFNVTFIGGGARGTQHFTEMVGGNVVVTINWTGTADNLLEENPPVVERFFNPVPEYVVEELVEKLPDYRRGFFEGAIKPDEYDDFGPLVKFRNSFLKDWKSVLEEAERRIESR